MATQQVFDDVDVERGKTRVTEILSAPAPKPERKPRSDKGTHKKPAPDLGGTLSRSALETRRLMQAWADALDVALTAIAARNRAEDELQRYLDEITAK